MGNRKYQCVFVERGGGFFYTGTKPGQWVGQVGGGSCTNLLFSMHLSVRLDILNAVCRSAEGIVTK